MVTKQHLTLLALMTALPDEVIGAEDDENAGSDSDDSTNDSSQQEEENAGSGSDDSQEDDSDDDDDDDNDPKTKGLRSALAAERKLRKALEKKDKAHQREKEERELAKKSDVEKAEAKAKKAEERAAKLASGLLTDRLNAAITKAAQDAGFIDVDDAIAGVDVKALEYEQDEDDPTDITINVKTVEQAVKKLATKKPHFLSRGTDDGEPTGSQFGGSRKKKQTNEEELKAKYPSL